MKICVFESTSVLEGREVAAGVVVVVNEVPSQVSKKAPTRLSCHIGVFILHHQHDHVNI